MCNFNISQFWPQNGAKTSNAVLVPKKYPFSSFSWTRMIYKCCTLKRTNQSRCCSVVSWNFTTSCSLFKDGCRIKGMTSLNLVHIMNGINLLITFNNNSCYCIIFIQVSQRMASARFTFLLTRDGQAHLKKWNWQKKYVYAIVSQGKHNMKMIILFINRGEEL